jgi:hypothetical protein
MAASASWGIAWHELGGGSELPPIGITEIRRIIVDPKHGMDEQDC